MCPLVSRRFLARQARALCPGPNQGRGRSARLVGELVRVSLTQVRRLALVAGDGLLLDLLNFLGSANRHLAVGAEDPELRLEVSDVGGGSSIYELDGIADQINRQVPGVNAIKPSRLVD